jgi:hypothetical protein
MVITKSFMQNPGVVVKSVFCLISVLQEVGEGT